MKSNLQIYVFLVAVLTAPFSLASRAGELGSLDPSKCKDVGDLGKACAEVPPKLSLTVDRFNALKNARAPSNEEVELAKKIDPSIGTLDTSQCNNSGGLGPRCAIVRPQLYLTNQQFNILTGR